MNAVSVDVATILEDEGIGTIGAATGWSINIGTEPEYRPSVSPHTTITVYDTGGSLDSYLTQSVNPVAQNTFQIRVRSKSYTTGYTKILQIIQLLEPYPVYTETGGTYDVKYYSFTRVGDIFSLGLDDNKRQIWVVNFRTTRHESNT